MPARHIDNFSLLARLGTRTTMSDHSPAYPGFGLPLRHWPEVTYASDCWTYSSLLPLREVVMMDIMSKLTDKPDWHRKVFDEEIISRWKAEAMAVPDKVWLKAAVVTKRWKELQGVKFLSEDAWEYVSGLFASYKLCFCLLQTRWYASPDFVDWRRRGGRKGGTNSLATDN